MSFSRHACKRRYTFRWLGLQREFHGLGGGQSADKPSISVGDQHRASEQSKANLNAANQNMSQVLRHSPAQQLAVRDGLTRASLCKSGSLYACFAEATRITKKREVTDVATYQHVCHSRKGLHATVPSLQSVFSTKATLHYTAAVEFRDSRLDTYWCPDDPKRDRYLPPAISTLITNSQR